MMAGFMIMKIREFIVICSLANIHLWSGIMEFLRVSLIKLILENGLALLKKIPLGMLCGLLFFQLGARK